MDEIRNITNRLRNAIMESGYTYAQLEQKTNIPKSTLQRWASGGIKKIPIDAIVTIADAIGVSAKWILGWSETPAVAMPASGVIPIVGVIRAGYPILAEENIIGYQVAPVKNTDEYFYLRVTGDSMINKGITDGCLVLIHRQETAENGQIVACRVNSDDATLKIFSDMNDTVFLMPANPKYSPIIVPKNQFLTGEAAIYGVVKYVMTEIL